MRTISLFLVLPFVILSVGLTILSLADIMSTSGSAWALPVIYLFVLIGFLVFLINYSDSASPKGINDSKDRLSSWYSAQETMATLSIIAIWPMLARNVVVTLDKTLVAILIVLTGGFVLTILGMFVKNSRAIIYSNIGGGLLVLIYGYNQIWLLGEGARVIAAAFGLVAAVATAIIKFRKYLTA